MSFDATAPAHAATPLGAEAPLKVLDVTEFYSPLGGGVRRYLDAKARWVARQPDIAHVVAVPSDRDAEERWHATRVYHLRGPSVPKSPGYHFLIAARKLGEIIAREQPHIIEVGSPFFAPWLAREPAERWGARLVGMFHSDDRTVWTRHALRNAPRFVTTLVDAASARYFRAVHRVYDATVVTSATARDSLAAIGLHDVPVIPLGADTESLRPERRDPAWRDEVGAPEGARIALYAGRLATEKNLDLMLRALPALHDEAGVYLVLIGEGHQRARLEAWARAHPSHLRVLPFERDRERLARAYASADLFVAPCPIETFGLAALEALASGLPVVGANQGGVGDLLRDAPAARTFDADDPADLRRAVAAQLAASHDPAALHQWVAERFSWDRTFETLFALYARLDGSAAQPLGVGPQAGSAPVG